MVLFVYKMCVCRYSCFLMSNYVKNTTIYICIQQFICAVEKYTVSFVRINLVFYLLLFTFLLFTFLSSELKRYKYIYLMNVCEVSRSEEMTNRLDRFDVPYSPSVYTTNMMDRINLSSNNSALVIRMVPMR